MAEEINVRPVFPFTSIVGQEEMKLALILNVIDPKAVNQIPTTGQAARKKCSERELLKEAYWKIKRPK